MLDSIPVEVPCPSTIKNLKGENFGQLSVLYYIGRHRNNTGWLCECSCGCKFVTTTTALTTSTFKSCKTCKIKNRPKTQVCTVCNVEKDFTEDNFYKHVNAQYGLLPKCKECFKKEGKANGQLYRERLRFEALEHYGNGVIKCNCCGERELTFLALDHIEGNGNKERKEIGYANFFLSLKRKGYPQGYQILCHNCNFAKWLIGKCPHQIEREENGDN